MTSTILCEMSERGVATITLNRPHKHNAFDEGMIQELISCLDSLDVDTTLRLVLLKASGKTFSAGADLAWMKKMGAYTPEENLADAQQLANLMRIFDQLPCPTIAVIEGSAFGGALGLIAAADIAISVETAQFSLSEVRLGLLPAVISPYIVRSIGGSQSRRYMLTGEKFSAEEAFRLGLIHQVVLQEELHGTVDHFTSMLLSGGPRAQKEIKRMLYDLRGASETQAYKLTTETIAEARTSSEGQEGIQAFFDKRAPSW